MSLPCEVAGSLDVVIWPVRAPPSALASVRHPHQIDEPSRRLSLSSSFKQTRPSCRPSVPEQASSQCSTSARLRARPVLSGHQSQRSKTPRLQTDIQERATMGDHTASPWWNFISLPASRHFPVVDHSVTLSCSSTSSLPRRDRAVFGMWYARGAG